MLNNMKWIDYNEWQSAKEFYNKRRNLLPVEFWKKLKRVIFIAFKIERKGIIETPYGWIAKKEKEAMVKVYKREQKRSEFMIFFATEEQKQLHKDRAKRNEDNRKWAWVIIEKTRKMCWVDDKAGKAYKADGYNATYIEIKNFTFDRWCTSFDL